MPTDMRTTILVPIDFSDASLDALGYASDLAARGGETLHLLYVVDRAPCVAGPEGEYVAARIDRLIEEDGVKARTQLETLAEDLRRQGFTVTVSSREGSAAAEILKAAVELDAGLIAMGTHGRTGLRHLLLGSVAESVMRKAACPVLTLRAAPRRADEKAA